MKYYTTKMPPNIKKMFFCKICDFKCAKYSNYKTHLLTQKHINWHNDTNDTIKTKHTMTKPIASFSCNCGKMYYYSSGLSRHKNAGNCSFHYPEGFFNSLVNTSDKSDIHVLSDLVIEVVKQNKELIMKNGELTNQLVEICKNGTSCTNNNSHNKTFNLQFFLNEQCKDAMNIMDFVDSLNLQLSDLENVGKQGFVEGISNIIVKNLKALDVHKRPVHCSDPKREVMYIKDENKWQKENDNMLNLRKAIKYIAHKNSKLIPKFKEKYPDCGKSHSNKSDQYNKLIIEAMGGLGDNDNENENKIIRKIAKEVIINKTK
jgi:hypothetical protein